LKTPLSPFGHLRRFIECQEAGRATLVQCFTAVAAAILARNFLESMLEGDQILGFSPLARNSFYSFFDHFFLFYVSIFLWLVLLLSLLAREDVKKVGRMAALFSPVILIVPVLDAFLSRGVGYRLGYLVGTGDIVPAVQFFDIREELYQITWGQRLEVLTVCCLASGYVWLKRASWTRSILAFVIVYAAMFVHGLPQLLTEIPKAFGFDHGVRAIMGGGLVDVDNQNYSFYMLLLAVPVALILLRMADPEEWREFLHGLRRGRSWSSALFAILGLGLGYAVFRYRYEMTFINPYNYLACTAAAGALLVASARPARFWPAAFGGLIAFFLSLNVGWTCLVFAGLVFVFARLRGTLVIILLFSLAGGFSLFAQQTTWSLPIPGGQQKLAGFVEYRQAREYFVQRDWLQAARRYEGALRFGFKNHQLSERLAESYVNLGTPEKAVPRFREAARACRNDPESYLGLGGIYYARGQFDSTLAVYYSAVEKKVERDRFYIEIGRIYSRIGEFEMARGALNKAALLGAKRDVLYQSLADLALFSSKPSEALRLYSRVLKYNPRYALAYNGMATIYHMENDYHKAYELYREALDLAPENPTILNNIGALYLDLGKADEAYKMVSKALAVNPMLAEGYYNMGRIFEMLDAREQARDSYRKALDINPNVPGAREALRALEANVEE
jgi:tetratricopeptide (TPR) repeat protein